MRTRSIPKGTNYSRRDSDGVTRTHQVDTMHTEVFCDPCSGSVVLYEGSLSQAKEKITMAGGNISSTGVVRCKSCFSGQSVAVGRALGRL